MNANEREVIELIEGGMPMRRVAEDTGLSFNYVKQVSSRFGFDSLERQYQRQLAKVRAATKAHERAILATGKRYS